MFNGKLDIVWPAVLVDPLKNTAQFKDAAAVLRQELAEVKAQLASKMATVETTLASRMEARLEVATSQATLAAAAAAAATTAGDGQAGWPTAKRGGKSRLAAGAAAVRPDDAANAEGQLLESGQRQRKEMDLRVVVKTGTAPAPESAKAELESVLQHRVQLPQQEVAAAMQDVAHIQVLPKRAGPGYTLLITFRTPAIKAAVYRLRNAWRSNGSEGPALAIGHNLTAAQQEAHMRLFPSMQQIWAQEVPVQMLYYPAVCLRVGGRLCSTATEAEAAAAAHLRKSAPGGPNGGLGQADKPPTAAPSGAAARGRSKERSSGSGGQPTAAERPVRQQRATAGRAATAAAADAAATTAATVAAQPTAAATGRRAAAAVRRTAAAAAQRTTTG
jgi:hypothetical protein